MSSAPAPSPQEPRGLARRGALLVGLLALAYLGFSGVFSLLAPSGLWLNEIFGDPLWLEGDPGAFYLASAHELRWGAAPLYVGHPGATLTPLLHGTQRLLYALEAPEGVSFSRFTAQNVARVFVLSKLLATVLHLVSFAAVYALAKELLRDARAARFAVAGYATSFPVLYFLSRISVEPLMVAFFAATFLAVWRAQELGSAGRSVAALAYAGLAALAAVSGSMTKLVFLGPLPFFAGVQLLTSRAGGPWRTRIAGSFVFAAVALAAHLVYSQIVDWQAFFQQWNAVAARPGVQRAWTLRDFLPGWSAGRIFLLAEVDFWLLGALGWLGFLLRARGRRGRALWLSAFVAYALLVFAYRVSLERSFLPFNYAFVAQAVAAVFFGWATTELWRRLRLPASGWRGAAAASAWLVLLHGIGAWAVVDARRHDARVFDANRSALELAARLGPSERIGIELEPGAESATANLTALHGITFPYVTPRRSRLSDAFAALFGPAPAGAEAGDEGRVPSPALGATLVIVRSAPADPR